jgi:hypothetical protein
MAAREARGGVSANDFNTPGPTPGSTKAITQRKAISEGYEAAPTKRMTNTNQSETSTGGTDAPGMTHRGGRTRR